MSQNTRPPLDPSKRTLLIVLLFLAIASFTLGAVGPFGSTFSFVLFMVGAVLAMSGAVIAAIARGGSRSTWS